MIDQFLDGLGSVACHGDARNYRNNFVVVACAAIAPHIRERKRSPDGLDHVGTHILRESRIKLGGVL